MNIMPVSGGGGGMNFRVIGGTTAPANPKENDILVNTNTKITDWAFSSEEPFIRTENVDCVIAKETTRLDSTGTEGYFPQANLTDYIKLPDGTTKITTNNCDTVTSTMCHAFYTANKTLISTVLRKEGTTTFEVPSNAVYVRLSMFDNAPVNSDPLSFVATIGVESGFVWILTGTSSSVEFNALKKNGIRVYPLSAKQYISGVWVDVEATTYQGGEWVDWILFLYNNGDEFLNITGGWERVNGTLTKNADNLTLTNVGASSSTYAVAYTANMIDLTNVKEIRVIASGTVTSDGLKSCCMAVTKTKTTTRTAAVAEVGFLATLQEHVLDVSSLTGSFYIGIMAAGSSSRQTTAITKKMWMER